MAGTFSPDLHGRLYTTSHEPKRDDIEGEQAHLCILADLETISLLAHSTAQIPGAARREIAPRGRDGVLAVGRLADDCRLLLDLENLAQDDAYERLVVDDQAGVGSM